ncbi:hypothetical protein GPECTOR_60g763 [Gonium pectorale]|uniref:Trafficking protein particle complex subunit 11 domain-containing protein n=1 Tax=Gonium pectorale TaxID=33097 RepID=A0A150G589_GONPE|nr:hypothetical protein GPECTOR_60g763 [Gonium pectorale]|eukprot:KXZ44984.1 hypothetical protein GPECTOR_60g763 [Gonium pectorale]
MAVALVERHALEGDPTTWNRMMYGLKLIADAAGQRGAGVLVAVVQQQGLGDLPPDRVQAVAHNLSLDRRLILALPILPPTGALPDDPAIRHVRDGALARLGKLVLELCTAYYTRLARHVTEKAAARRNALGGPLPPELAARTAFKLAVYAEFRQDWATAVAHYREAYAAILALQVGTPPRPQRWTEVCAVAELVHLKLIMLAVHQGRLEDAVAQVRAHLAYFGKPPGMLAPASQASHLGYLVRQHQVAAQEVGTHVDALPPYVPTPAGGGGTTTGGGPAGAGFTGSSTVSGLNVNANVSLPGTATPAGLQQPQLTGGGGGAVAGATGTTTAGLTGQTGTGALPPPASSSSLKDCSRAHLLMAAARLAVARRQAADTMRASRAGGGAAGGAGGGPMLDTAPVRRGQYIGQLVLRNEAAQGGYSPLSDHDYLLFLESEESRLVTPALVIDVMSSALLLLKDSTGKSGPGSADRLRSQLGGMMATEHIQANNLSAARKLLLQVCHQYRREGWLLPLLQALVSLREVAQRLRLPAEHLCYSLEIAALATQLQPLPPSAQQPPLAAAAVMTPPRPRTQHPIALLTGAAPTRDAGVGGAAAAALASCSNRIVDTTAAVAACRSAVQTLVTGISEIKQGIMKASASGVATAQSSPEAATPAGGPSPETSASQLQLPAGGLAQGQTPAVSTGLPRHFHYTVEHLDLRKAQQRAREAGDTRPVAEIMHKHTQHDYGWCRCVALAAGFTYGRPDMDTADFYLALYNQLPLPLPLKGVVLHFADDQGDMWVQALPGVLPPDEQPAPPLPQHIGSALDSATHSFHHLHLNSHLRPHSARLQDSKEAGERPAEDGVPVGDRLPGQVHQADGPPSTSSPSPHLPPHRWTHFSVRLAPRCLGSLRAERAILLLSDHATVVFKLASFPPANAAAPQPGVLTGPLLVPPGSAGGGASVDHAAAPFRSIRVTAPAGGVAAGPGAGGAVSGGPAVSPGQLSLTVAHLGPLPRLTYGLPAGLALLGEHAPLLAVLTVPPGGRQLSGASMEFVIGRTTGGLQPGDIVLVVDDTEGTKGLMALNNERYRIPLPPVEPGTSHTVRLWARSAAAGTAAVAAVLLCPAQVTATATLTFDEPFEFKCKMASEVGVHTLSLPRLSARELGVTALTIGQPVMVTAMIRALQPATLEVAGAQVMLEPGAAIKLVADPNQQLSAQGPGTCSRLARGDVLTLLLPICPTELLDHGRSMGRLNLRWRRPAGQALRPAMPQLHQQHQQQQQAAGQGKGEGAAVGEVEGGADPLAEPCPDPWVTTVLELPRITVAESLLTARTLGPSQVTAGIPFTYSLQLQNFGSTPLELMISLMDAPGFSCANERSPSLAVPPRERSSVAWSLTATAPGHTMLPSVRLLAPRHNCALTTQNQHVYVQPL